MFPAQWSSDHIVSSIGISQIWITDESSPTAATVRVSIHLICFAWIDFWYLHHSIKTFRQNIFEHICKKINICHDLLRPGLFCHPNIIALKNIVSIYNIYHLYRMYRVSHNTVSTLFLSFSRVLELVQRNFWPLFNSPWNLLHNSHMNFENWFRNSLDNWHQSWHPSFWNWHFAITESQKSNFGVTGANFDLNYLSCF